MIGPELEPGHGSPGHRVSDYGRVGSDLGSKLYMNRPGAVTRFPGEQQTSSVRPLAPSKRVPLIASQLVPRLAAPCYCLQTPPPHEQIRGDTDMIGNKSVIFTASVTRTFTTGVAALLDVKLR